MGAEEETQKDQLIDSLYSEVDRLQNSGEQANRNSSLANYPKSKDSNLIQVQIESVELLQKLERFYCGDYLGTDDEGQPAWCKQPNKELIPLNEYGVSVYMGILTKYIDKNTILSNYNEERIFEILADIGDELTLVTYCNYETMGLDTPAKKTKFRLLIVTTLHVIESSYRRAIGGETMKGLNESKIVSQSENVGRPQMAPINPGKKKSMMDPRTW